VRKLSDLKADDFRNTIDKIIKKKYINNESGTYHLGVPEINIRYSIS